jgi:hypothetical protein
MSKKWKKNKMRIMVHVRLSGLWSHDQFPKMVKSKIKELEWRMTVSGKNTDVLE